MHKVMKLSKEDSKALKGQTVEDIRALKVSRRQERRKTLTLTVNSLSEHMRGTGANAKPEAKGSRNVRKK